jgi:hypothetical protein
MLAFAVQNALRVADVPIDVPSRIRSHSNAPKSSDFSAQRASLRQRDISDLDILVAPLVEELDATDFLGNLLWKDLVAADGLDLDFSVVRHVGDVLTC